MDFAKLENIVSKRKLPTADETKKKRRRITPSPAPGYQQPGGTPFDQATPPAYTPPGHSVMESLATIASVYTPPESSTTLPLSTISPDNNYPPSSYNTTIGYLESTLIVKKRFNLSDEVYILVGLAIDEDMRAIMYLIDKRLWMQIEISPECLTKIMHSRQKIDEYFHNPSLADEVFPLYTKMLRINPSIGAAHGLLSFARYRKSEIPDNYDNLACWNIVDEFPVPTIDFAYHVWCNLAVFTESITEYFNLCLTSVSPANQLVTKYVNDFKALFRPTAAAAAGMRGQQDRIKEDMKLQLQTRVSNHHYTRLVADVVLGCNKEITSPFGAWLDAELRANCYHHLALRVLNELSKEFDWLKDKN